MGAWLSSQATSEATGRKGVRYKSAKMHWLGHLTDIITVVTVRNDSGIKSVNDAIYFFGFLRIK